MGWLFGQFSFLFLSLKEAITKDELYIIDKRFGFTVFSLSLIYGAIIFLLPLPDKYLFISVIPLFGNVMSPFLRRRFAKKKGLSDLGQQYGTSNIFKYTADTSSKKKIYIGKQK